MFKRVCASVCLIAASGCGGNGAPGAPTNTSITVMSAHASVLFGATEQMTAAGSDGRPLTSGTWSSDNTSVATVSSAGLVTPVGAGQATVSFSAGGLQGAKVLRAIPNLAGTFSGAYSVTSCDQSGQIGDTVNVCGSATVGALLSYRFTFTQSADVVSGQILLGSNEFDNMTGTIDVGGHLDFSAHLASGAAALDVVWHLIASQPGQLGGTVSEVLSSRDLSGQAVVGGGITSLSRVASVSRTSRTAAPQTIDEMVRALMAR